MRGYKFSHLAFLGMVVLLTGCVSQEKREEGEKAKQLAQHNFNKALIAATDAFQAAEDKAVVTCQNKEQCDKAWSLTQLFINDNSSMKIQLATDSIIETYNPSDYGQYSLSATKTPGTGESATIKLTFRCDGLTSTSFEANWVVKECLELGTPLLNSFATQMGNNDKPL